MPTQYDSIGAKYDTLNATPIQQIQHVMMKKLLGPLNSSNRILELAYGTGFYTRQMILWGASHVTALDISPVMISAAEQALPTAMKHQVSFCVANCSRPDIWDNTELKDQQGTFDFVVAAWMLNYAASGKEMRGMFENAYLALKPGGRMIALTIHARIIDMFQPNDPLNESERYLGTAYDIVEKVDDGYKMRCVSFGEPKLEWEFYFLREDVYSKAAAEAGMGQLEWNVVLPEEEFLLKLVSLPLA